ncbi:hypothetical protein [Rhodoblastus acidophilus]|uniref:hypothetical protein n=1 Tax=Rhodoblastus acidophilus TaxID=1074 RepID=UPI0012D7304D|nr:hypothetical protein [Rhodoblastus acidophilus]
MPDTPTPAKYDRNVAVSLKTGKVVRRGWAMAAAAMTIAAFIGATLMIGGLALMFGAWTRLGLIDPMFWFGAFLVVGGVSLFGRRWRQGAWVGDCPACGSPVFIVGRPKDDAIGADCNACRSRVILRAGKFTTIR